MRNDFEGYRRRRDVSARAETEKYPGRSVPEYFSNCIPILKYINHKVAVKENKATDLLYYIEVIRPFI